MQVLVHLGLNKCASTFVQHTLDGARPTLQAAGTWYPRQEGLPCQYGLSKQFGFGPDDENIELQRIDELIEQAVKRRCDSLILSSEYLSLYRPRAAERMWKDLTDRAESVELVVFSREVFGWIRSLFNQYVKTVEGLGQLDDLNSFVDQVLHNRAIDLAARIGMWRALAPDGTLKHYRLEAGQNCHSALTVFEAFAGLAVELDPARDHNRSIDPAALFRLGQLRRKLPSHDRNIEIQRLLAGGASPYPAPDGFLDISADRRARIIREIVTPYALLPCSVLPESGRNATRQTVMES